MQPLSSLPDNSYFKIPFLPQYYGLQLIRASDSSCRVKGFMVDGENHTAFNSDMSPSTDVEVLAEPDGMNNPKTGTIKSKRVSLKNLKLKIPDVTFTMKELAELNGISPANTYNLFQKIKHQFKVCGKIQSGRGKAAIQFVKKS